MAGDETLEDYIKRIMQEEFEKQLMLEQGKRLYGDMSGPFADALRGPEYDKWRAAMDEEQNAG